ncbi:2-C-methyl-D-erythritol 4-phosphate cytidylyltransferase [Chloracidobacterium aggregatum]|uniref:2-C-methyl-D-erythritol 4-phosphate cytidylyltransferase n=1 Tax=Chloracidobacterium aggregatum TaxID=2851959 RepID=UPI001B8C8DD2|nr:2-C-methyl-D-erythritol 4-phosphate cytidylyltransferase [Chloracidobacterium aggregatum]QUV97323.1 2-C-methyl-D-erythritol 4-phosphate cytidylyltransferase [Chloracidobacterium sp. E]
MTAVAIVPAGGLGVRFGADRPKQFLELAGRPIIIHTLRRLAACPDVSHIVVALPPTARPVFAALLETFPVEKPITAVAGGAERQESVRLALAAVPDGTSVVVVHDAVRPFATTELITATIAAARADRAAVVGHPATDTIKLVRDGLAYETPPRSTLYAVQTPQAFETGLLRDAHARAAAEQVTATDDAMLVERLGVPVRIVPGPRWNLKITHPDDLPLADFLWQRLAREPT